MSKKILVLLAVMVPIAICIGLVIYAMGQDLAIINTGGEIARRQYEILRFAFLLSMIVIIPVFALTVYISLRFKDRKNFKKSDYQPNWHESKNLEITWWGIPILIIIVLSLVTWRTSHTLDPYRPLDNPVKPVEVQVVALQWKWLFLYPEYNIATVNYLKIPESTPINFHISADAPMNSFWIPKLGGQIYAMNGMSTKLHLIADEKGEFEGVSANISGEGFADMRFSVVSVDNNDFHSWINQIKDNGNDLTLDRYEQVAAPSVPDKAELFGSFEPELYNIIISKFMPHGTHTSSGSSHEAHSESILHSTEHNHNGGHH